MSKQDTPKQHPLISDNSQVNVTIPWTAIHKEYQKQLQKVAKTAKTDGFRVGKVPLPLVEQMVDKDRLYQEALNPIFPQYYGEALKAVKALPISQPELEPVSMEPGKDWVFTAHFAARPEFKLGKYQEIVKKARQSADEEMAKEEVARQKAEKEAAKGSKKASKEPEVKPGSTKPLTDEEKDDHRITHVFQALLEAIKIPVPELLVRQETNRQLEQLGRQLQQFGLDPKKYLESRKMSEEELVKEYSAHALGVLQTEFLLAEIAKEQKITVEDKELNEYLSKMAGGKLSDEQRQNPDYRGYVFSTLLKRKVVEYLLSL
jgi:FKBP-type peptidyl-prolyl cis-trans isomerase (trigger factor)